jgi:tetratricopeptide (TPR) repeat protein
LDAVPAETVSAREWITSDPTADVLASGAAADPDYALDQAHRLPDQPELAEARANLLLRAASGFSPQHRLELAEAAVREARSLLSRQGEESSSYPPPALAEADYILAVVLGQRGQRAEALGPAREAVERYRALAAQNSGAFTPSLAMALNSLANRLGEVGRRAEALGPAKEAVEHYRALAVQKPNVFMPGLAMALNTLASRLGAMGQRAEALGPAQEAVELRSIAPWQRRVRRPLRRVWRGR